MCVHYDVYLHIWIMWFGRCHQNMKHSYACCVQGTGVPYPYHDCTSSNFCASTPVFEVYALLILAAGSRSVSKCSKRMLRHCRQFIADCCLRFVVFDVQSSFPWQLEEWWSSFCWSDRSACFSSLNRFCFGVFALRMALATAARMPSVVVTSPVLVLPQTVKPFPLDIVFFFDDTLVLAQNSWPFSQSHIKLVLVYRFGGDRLLSQRSSVLIERR